MELSTLSSDIICHICGIKFTSKLSNLRRHLKVKHGVIESRDGNSKCLETDCKFVCFKLNDLRKHLEISHQIYQDVEELHFGSFEDFSKWKIIEESKEIVLGLKIIMR